MNNKLFQFISAHINIGINMDLCEIFYSTGISDYRSNKQNQHHRSCVRDRIKIIGNRERVI